MTHAGSSRWLLSAGVLSLALLCGRTARAGTTDLERFYRRMVQLYEVTATDEQAVLADSVLRSPAATVDERKLARLFQGRILRVRGRALDALAIIDSMATDTLARHPLVRFLSSNERTRCLKQLGLFPEAALEGQRSLAVARGNGLKEEVVISIILLAEIDRRQGQYDAALDKLVTAEKLADSSGYLLGQCNVRINRANVLYYQERYPEALAMYRAARRCAGEHGFRTLEASALYNIGSTLSSFGADSARAALQVYVQELEITRSLKDRSGEADVYTAMAVVHNGLRQFNEAREAINHAMAIRRELKDTLDLAVELRALARTEMHAGAPEQALGYAEQSLSLSRANRSLVSETETLRLISDILREMGRYREADERLLEYEEANEKLQDKKCGEATLTTEYRYETEKKEVKIKLQKAQLDKSEAVNRERMVQLQGVLIIAGLLLAVLALLFRNNQHMRRVQAQTQLLHEQEVNQLLKKQEIRSLDAMMQGQEQERKRVAKDLHDRLGTMLSVIKLQFSGMESRLATLEDRHQDRYQHAFGLLDEAVVEVRRISHDMVRGNLDRFGLVSALEDLCGTLQAPGKLEVELTVFGLEERLDHQLEIAVYRMVQEAVGNVLKHAKASEISIQLMRAPASLNVIIEDNGVGFDPTGAREGMGLGNLRERAAEFKGTVAIDSKVGRGTVITIDIPLG